MKNLYIIILLLLGMLIYKVQAQDLLEHLPELDPMTTKYLFSSYDPKGGNADGFESGNYLYSADHGSINNPDFVGGSQSTEYVMVDMKDAGAVKRFWNARFEKEDTVRYYIDGSPTPIIELTLDEIFYQKKSPFDQGLTYSYSENTGALLTYLPLYFESSLIVTIDNPIGYYQFDVEKYGDGPKSIIEQEMELEGLQMLFENASKEPEYMETSLMDSLTFNLAPGESVEIFNKIGSHTIKGITLDVASISNKNSINLLSDECRFFEGKSQFKLKIDRSATNYKIIGRQSNRTGQRRARVRINGRLTPNWLIPQPDFIDHQWKDYTYEIPSAVNMDRDSATFILEQVNGLWVDFTYWMICDGVITDSIDVGNLESESAHSYSVENEILSDIFIGRQDADQLVKESNSHILNNVNIQANWDNNDDAAIKVPLSYFFMLGERDAKVTESAVAGYNGELLYNYLPMPFSESGSILLTNNSDSTLNDIKVRIAYDMIVHESCGYLHAHYHKVSTDLSDNDVSLLNIGGHGKLVAVILNGDGPKIDWLEGDDRVYIDNMNTPLIHGTGTEDIFSGGDYFLLGERNLPFGSFNYGEENYYNMHRSFVSDPIYFRDGLLFNLQRGGDNDIRANYNSMVFYYLNDKEPLYSQQEFLNISENGAAVQRYDHNQFGGTYMQGAGTFDGTYDNIPVHNNGFNSIDSSEFTAIIPQNNDGIILHRGMSYEEDGQCAKVYANDQYVGEWCTMGKNAYNLWSEDVFMIPAEYTNSSEEMTFKFVAEKGNWSELYYRINVIGGEFGVISSSQEEQHYSLAADMFPNPMRNRGLLKIHNPNIGSYKIHVIDATGKIQRIYENLGSSLIEIERENLSPGFYILMVYDEDNSEPLGTYRFIVN